MKDLARSLIPARLRRAVRLYRDLPSRLAALDARLRLLESGRMVEAPPPGSGEAGFKSRSILNQRERKVYSQNGEDGILEFIFESIGTTNRTFVEFGIEDGRECNCAHLALDRGWNGLLMDADPTSVSSAQAYYREQLGSDAERVQVQEQLVTPDNINLILEEADIEGEIDLLAIDIDGNDLWVWEAVRVIQPRVVVIEYNASFGPVRSLSTRYREPFDRFAEHASGMYHGASLAALARSGRRRGYLLAGCESTGVNAFFIWEAAAAGSGIGEIPVRDAFYPMRHRSLTLTSEEQFEVISRLDLVEV